MRQQFIIFFIILILLLLGAGFYFREEIKALYQELNQKLLKAEEITIDNFIEEIERQISTPPPLRIEQNGELAELTSAEVVSWTNVYRIQAGLPSLTRSAELDKAASIKAQDMFNNQYFAHQSPTGEGPAELAQKAGYDFLAIGENLALGNFASEQALMEAWMNSPGHRANILSKSYTEIGIAVVKGVFEKKETWLAVQEFGLPKSACPEVDKKLKAEIEFYEKQLNELETVIASERLKLENARLKTTPEYIQRVNEYNRLVAEYNELIKIIKYKINVYNFQVQRYNACISQ